MSEIVRSRQEELFPLSVPIPEGAKWAELCADALLVAKKRRSDNTLKTYRKQFDAWAQWCHSFGVTSVVPIDPRVLVSHLEWLAKRGYKRSTILLRLAVLSNVDNRSRMSAENPHPAKLRSHELVVSWWQGFCRENPQNLKQAPFVTREQIARVLRVMYSRRPTPLRHVRNARDAALILIGYLGACRRSELAAMRVGDLILSERGLTIVWQHSKGDQLSLGVERLILPQDELELCAVEAWKRWLGIYRQHVAPAGELDPKLPAFPILKSGVIQNRALVDTQVFQMIARRSKDARVAMSPHSLRAAFATHATEVGEETEVADHGRWRSPGSMKPYVRRSRAWKKNATRGLGRLSLE
jgi:integrase